MRELFRFLSNYRGQSLVFSTASVALLGKKVTIPLKIARLDFDLAKALLRSQGFLVLEDSSIEGERELRIELVQNEK